MDRLTHDELKSAAAEGFRRFIVEMWRDYHPSVPQILGAGATAGVERFLESNPLARKALMSSLESPKEASVIMVNDMPVAVCLDATAVPAALEAARVQWPDIHRWNSIRAEKIPVRRA